MIKLKTNGKDTLVKINKSLTYQKDSIKNNQGNSQTVCAGTHDQSVNVGSLES